MGVAQNGRSVQRVVYVDENLVEHIVLTAYLGDRLVWDGHVSQVLQVPCAISTSRLLTPAMSADGVLAVAGAASSYSQANDPSVTGGATVAPDVATSMSAGYMPGMFTEQILAVPTATSASSGLGPDVHVVFGATVPLASSTSIGYAPDVHADAVVTPTVASSTTQASVPQVGSFSFVNSTTATATSQAFAPAVSGGVKVTPPLATSASQALMPTVSATALVVAPLATGTGVAQVPQINSGLPVAFDTSVTASQSLGVGQTLSKTITVAQSGSGIVVFARFQAGWSSNITIDGVAMADMGEVRPNTSTHVAKLFALPGVSAGTHTITYSPAVGAGTAGVYFIAASFANASTISSDIAVASGNGGSSSVTIPGTGSMPVSFLAAQTQGNVTPTAPAVQQGATASDNGSYSYNGYRLFTSTQSPIATTWFAFADWLQCGFWLA